MTLRAGEVARAVARSGRLWSPGLWYDLGFMLGISGFSGGVFAGSRGKGGAAR
jgi:hypothetical protein